MKIGSGAFPQVVVMAVVSVLLGYAIFMAGQASLAWGYGQEIKRGAAEQSELVKAVQEINRRPADQVSRNDRERNFNTLKGLADRQAKLGEEIDRARRLAVWPGLAVGAGYFAMCLITYFRALKRRKDAALFLSPAAIAGAREVLQGPFDVQGGSVKLTRQFGGADYAALEAMQLVAKVLLEGEEDEIELDISAETQPFSQFIGVLVSFAMDCDAAGKKLRIVCAPEAQKSMALVGLGELAALEPAAGEGAEAG